jgi:hypothetical protein
MKQNATIRSGNIGEEDVVFPYDMTEVSVCVCVSPLLYPGAGGRGDGEGNLGGEREQKVLERIRAKKSIQQQRGEKKHYNSTSRRLHCTLNPREVATYSFADLFLSII